VIEEGRVWVSVGEISTKGGLTPAIITGLVGVCAAPLRRDGTTFRVPLWVLQVIETGMIENDSIDELDNRLRRATTDTTYREQCAAVWEVRKWHEHSIEAMRRHANKP
jgi:hypothetical protein